jgi:hypothetical protein
MSKSITYVVILYNTPYFSFTCGHYGAIQSQGQPFTDNSSGVNESQSIDIN